MCHISHVICHMSYVPCQMSAMPCHKKKRKEKVVKLVGLRFVINGQGSTKYFFPCYPIFLFEFFVKVRKFLLYEFAKKIQNHIMSKKLFIYFSFTHFCFR